MSPTNKEHGHQKLLSNPNHGIRQQHKHHQGGPKKKRVRRPPTIVLQLWPTKAGSLKRS